MQKFVKQSKRNLIGFILSFISCYCIEAQNENRLIHPLFKDEFKSYYLLPNGTIRILAITDQNNGYGGNHPIYQDIRTGSLNDIPEPVSLEIPGHWFNSYTNELSSIGLKGGDIIIGNTQFDCDYDPPGGLMRLDRDGNIRWYIDFIDEGIYVSPVGLVFIDAKTILVKDYWSPDGGMIIDRDGNILTQSLPATIYDHTIETNFGFLASKDERLDVLDSTFKRDTSFELGSTIEKIMDLGNDRYVIQADNASFVFHNMNILEELPLPPEHYTIIGYTDFIWAIHDNTQIIRLDTSFTPLDTFELSPGVEPVICLPMSDGILGIGKYRDIRTVLFKAEEEEINFSLPQDIGITGVSMKDTVLAYPYHNYYLGIEFTLDSVWVDVTNFGEDTVTNFTILAPNTWSCFWCNDHSALWNIDSLVLAPGKTNRIFLGSYYSDCIQGGGTSWKVCFSTLSPNKKADGNYVNDTICDIFSLLISGTENILPDHSVRIRPVPASDFIYIEVDNINDQKFSGCIYDATGQRVKNFEVSIENEKISVADLDSGLYFLNIFNSKGLRSTKKFVVQH